MSTQPTLLLFPGLWVHGSKTQVEWWFRWVIKTFQSDYHIVPIVYTGRRFKDYIAEALRQMARYDDGVMAICHGAGAQIARAIAKQRPELFSKVLMISGYPHTGLPRTAMQAWLNLDRWFWGRNLLNKAEVIPRNEAELMQLFFPPLSAPRDRSVQDAKRALKARQRFAREILQSHMKAEPASIMRAVALPGFRLTTSPFPCPVTAIVPRDDVFLNGVSYADRVQVWPTRGGHLFIAGEERHVHSILARAKQWFTLSSSS